ncbi:M12 family metallo-peptidase [uncultured Nocardioides sp.]|uniref:M12 family metallo-peptidase n=1 Tax=uncultured Nocardioides sp. TaxID=198441 RepID=UPI0026344E9D|nr:M12 family metallo-peptidase [uncultured Nocardioides sp.]
MRPTPLVLLLVAALGLVLPTLGQAPATGADVPGPDGGGRDAAARIGLFAALDGYALPRADRVDGAPVRVRPETYAAYRLDVAGLARQLAGAAPGARSVRVQVPGPDGAARTLSVVEDPVLQAGLQAAHPEIRTYAGHVVGDPRSTVRLDVTPLGFHASVRGPEGAWSVDPAVDAPGETTHVVYDRAALPGEEELHRVAEGLIRAATPGRASGLPAAARTAPGALVQRRTFRLALVTDPAYARYFGTGGQPADPDVVLAQKAVLLNRVNQIYNDDLAIHMVLVDGSEELNLDTAAKATGPDGPCGASACFDAADLDPETGGCTGALLDRNRFVVGQIIGADRYDVGHLMLGINGGGVAYLGAVGGADKAGGCTGLPFPTGDFMAIDYVAHELGHQFAGNHTFNGTQGACAGGNRNGGTSVEPGSGSSVMAYAGICDTDDLQPHTDPAFSQRTIDEVTAHVTDSPGVFDEVQTISMTGFDDVDELTFHYPGAEPITIGTSFLEYNSLNISSTVYRLTGFRPTVVGYDALLPPVSADGFTLQFNVSAGRGVDVERVTVTGDAPGFTATTGVQVQGGPGTNQGFLVEETANHAPTVTAPVDRTIPLRTPFELTGSATDTDGDALTYLWEQNDTGGTTGAQLTSASTASGPLFRVFGTAAEVSKEESLTYGSPDLNLATDDPSRSFPDLAQVLSGNTNAATGSCPAASGEVLAREVVECYSERLPTQTRSLSFRLTARDGFATGGGTQYDDVTLTVGSAGPFRVTSQPAATVVEGGTTGTVTWDVAGTSAAAYAPQVRILLSTDGGETFPTVLATTANDGSEQVTWPRTGTERARLRVEAVDNYFYDVNRADFTIESPVRLTVPVAAEVQHSDPLVDAAGEPLAVEVTGADAETLDALEVEVGGVRGVSAVRRGDSGLFDLVGGLTDAPGTVEATVTVSGPEDLLVEETFPVTVTAEDLDVRWTGPSVAQLDEPVTLSVALTEPDDGSPGDPRAAAVTLVDRDGGQLCTATTAGTAAAATASCMITPTGEPRTITVGSVVTGTYAADDRGDDAALDLVVTVVDDVAPETSFVTAPAEILSSKRLSASLLSSEAGSSFRCTLDGRALPCADGAVAVDRLKSGTRVLEAAAVDEAGNVDATPVRAVFAVPYGPGGLKNLTGWKRVKSSSAFGGSFWRSDPRGALLTSKGKVKKADVLALVVSTGRKAGSITVDLGRRDLGRYSLKTDETRDHVVLLLDLDRRRSGKLEIRTLSKKDVQIEGIAWLTRP